MIDNFINPRRFSNAPSLFAGDAKNYRSLLKGKKFLVAEDNEVNQKVIRHVLQKAGGFVDIANNGLEAVSLLKQNNDYHLIIMDLQMPEMDGYDATKYIRTVMKLSIPIIAMTASALEGGKSKCIEIGMNDYLLKPFDFTFLYKRISLLLNDNLVNYSEEVFNNQESKNLYDLCLLKEMDDNEYISEILTMFLNNTPAELQELQEAYVSKQFDTVYKLAQTLKGITQLLKANHLVNILIKIEENAKAKNGGSLANLIDQANEAYKRIERALQEHLKNVHATFGIAV
ncbi:MAG: response regulator [Chitinophagaceae bacterium]|nr:response regulator [Chitinophagaceae bacterium]